MDRLITGALNGRGRWMEWGRPQKVYKRNNTEYSDQRLVLMCRLNTGDRICNVVNSSVY